MNDISRRTLLVSAAAGALALASPSRARGATLPREADIVVVGAGAAGIAAARRVREAGRSVIVLEAADHVGGRCVTDMATFGVPFDRGAHRLHQPESNPLAKLARGVDADILPASSGQRIWVGRRHARPGEMEAFLTTLVRATRAIEARATGKADIAAAAALPADLGEWEPTARFVLGPLVCGKDLAEVSADDYASAYRRAGAALCRQGTGALLARLADGLPVALRTPAKTIDWSGRNISVGTDAGTIACKAVVITVSVGVLRAGRIAFKPDLPKRQRDALEGLSLGTHERIALLIPGNPFGVERDDLIIEKSETSRTALLHARLGGSDLYAVDVAGSFGASLAAGGEAAMNAFAREWLGKLFGADAMKAVTKSAVTRWSADPLTGGACAVAKVGESGARAALMQPAGVLFFAGEAAHGTQWGTLNGAWESGERAAEDALRKIGALKAPDAPLPAPRRTRPRRQR